MHELDRRGRRTRLARGARRLFALCAWIAAADVARAQVDRIVVSEYLLRCTDASSDGAFVELVADGPGQVYDAALGLRLLGPSGSTVADMPGIFAPRSGQAWPEGQHFLVAMAGFEALTGVAPDAVLPAAPSSAAGSIVLYRPRTGGAIIVLQRVDYSSTSGQSRTPKQGRSAARGADGLYRTSPDPSPTRSDGTLARAPGCFADPRRGLLIQELATRCLVGGTVGGFVEISTTRTDQTLDGDLRLRVLDRNGEPIFDVPLGFESLEGFAWPPGRAWLVGGAGLVSGTGAPPNLEWPAPLDAAGGRVIVHGADALGAEVQVAELTYGTPGSPAPGTGASLVWDPFQGRHYERSPATPTDLAGAPHVHAGCSIPSSVRVREVLTACARSPQRGSYVELVATGSSDMRDTTLALDVRDSQGRLQGSVPMGFGARAGEPWPMGGSWLLATHDLTNADLARPDAALPFVLDTLAGRLELVRRAAGATEPFEVIQLLEWGTGRAAPGPGQALARFSDTDYRVTNSPAPRTSTGAVLSCATLVDTLVVPLTGEAEICVGCWNGSRRGQYVRWTLPVGALLDTNFALRIYDRDGQLIGTEPRLFGHVPRARLTSARSWLVADPGFGLPGAHMDAVLPAPLDSVGGAVEIAWSSGGVTRLSVRRDYGAPGPALAPPGYAKRIGLTETPTYPDPRTFATGSHPIGGCHFLPAHAGPPPRVTEVFLACSDRSVSSQYVLVGDIAPDVSPDPRLRLRIHDRSNLLRETIPARIPDPLPGAPGGGPRTLLLAGPSFEGVTGLAPDRPLAVPLDTVGGRIDLELDDAYFGAVYPVATVYYSAPPKGRAVTYLVAGQPSTRREPRAIRLDGRAASFPDSCRDVTPPMPMLFDRMALGCYDGDPRGQFIHLVASGREDSLSADFALVLRDHQGTLLGEVAPAFGRNTGIPVRGSGVLILPADSPSPVAPDALLPAPLDTLGGSISLVHRRGGERVLWTQSYRPSDPVAWPMGTAQRPSAGGGIPLPALLGNQSGETGFLDGCHLRNGTTPPIVLRSVLGACGDGSTASSYLELSATAETRDLKGLQLRVRDGRGDVVVPLFPDARPFDAWPANRSLLIASDAFEPAAGVPPDRRLPRAFGDEPAEISLERHELPIDPVRVLSRESFDFVARPEPGRALLRFASGWSSTTQPAPRNSSGAAPALAADCLLQVGRTDAVRLAEIFLACADQDPAAQYVRVERTSAVAARDPLLKLRILGASGEVLGERAGFFPPGGTYWGVDTSLVFGGPGFRATFGFPPDATLPATLDAAGGRLQLLRPGPQGDLVLSELHYGPLGTPVPEPGQSLRFEGSAWRADTLPHPSGFSGQGTPDAACRARCGTGSARFGNEATQPLTSAKAELSTTLGAIRFDLTRAEIDVRSEHKRAELGVVDFFALEESAGVDTLDALVDVLEHRDQLCERGFCVAASRRLRLFVDGELADSLGADQHGRATLRARVPFRPGAATRIDLAAGAEGVLQHGVSASVEARLRFERPRGHARIVSCQGYDSERARVVGDPEWAAGPRAVSVVWPESEGAGFTALVERLDEADPLGAWTALGTLIADAGGFLHFVDAKPIAGHVYRYRLRWSDRFTERTSDELRVSVPVAPSFHLFAPRPNPSRGSLRVDFELPEAAEVLVELFDAAGRRVGASRVRHAAGPGTVIFGEDRRLAPGLYVVRLQAEGRHSLRTAIVLP